MSHYSTRYSVCTTRHFQISVFHPSYGINNYSSPPPIVLPLIRGGVVFCSIPKQESNDEMRSRQRDEDLSLYYYHWSGILSFSLSLSHSGNTDTLLLRLHPSLSLSQLFLEAFFFRMPVWSTSSGYLQHYTPPQSTFNLGRFTSSPRSFPN